MKKVHNSKRRSTGMMAATTVLRFSAEARERLQANTH
jgi:hypothetical protein